MANLWVAKERLWQYLLRGRIGFDPRISFVDSLPLPVCRFARAYRCRLLPEENAFGYDEMIKQTFYGLRAHLRVFWPEVICGLSLAPADAHDLSVAEELLEGVREGWALGDKTYWSPPSHRTARREAKVGLAGALQVKEAGEGALAPLACAKVAQDRDRPLSAGGALPGLRRFGLEIAGTSPLMAREGIKPHLRRLLLSAGRSVPAELRGVSNRLKLAHRVS